MLTCFSEVGDHVSESSPGRWESDSDWGGSCVKPRRFGFQYHHGHLCSSSTSRHKVWTLDRAQYLRGRHNEWKQSVAPHSWTITQYYVGLFFRDNCNWFIMCKNILMDALYILNCWYHLQWRPGNVDWIVELVSLSVALTWFCNAWNCQNKTWWQLPIND